MCPVFLLFFLNKIFSYQILDPSPGLMGRKCNNYQIATVDVQLYRNALSGTVYVIPILVGFG